MVSPQGQSPAASGRGVNVVGYLTSASGLGHTSRLLVDVLRHRGYEVAGLDIEAHSAKESPGLGSGMLKQTVEDLPFSNTLIVAAIDRIPQLWLRHAKGLLSPRFRNAGVLFWELPTIPAAWLPSLRMFDVVVACSHYVRQTFEAHIPEVPTVFAEHPLPLDSAPADRADVRRRFRIPLDSTAYCCGFDLISGMARKNPMGAVRAWLRAFPTAADVSLVIKLNGSALTNQHGSDVDDFIRLAKADPRIFLINERLSHHDLMSLYHCCDVFVSLHRAEGLGLIPMEAMALGKLVVATGYSGNMTFMNEQNSLPVPYRLIAPAFDREFLTRRFAGRAAAWADPDIDEAARLLRSARDPELAKALGAQAKADMARRQETAWQARYLDQLFRLLEASDRHAMRAPLRRQIFMQEMLDPILRSKNIKAVLRRRG